MPEDDEDDKDEEEDEDKDEEKEEDEDEDEDEEEEEEEEGGGNTDIIKMEVSGGKKDERVLQFESVTENTSHVPTHPPPIKGQNIALKGTVAMKL
ncbi:hypothetical protein GRJ2_002956300 [Grus japonensis]|uniref:Uncharacterized protein n=1 Tax=Grus japonensis TaxID=30415 RepID=A0ABC9Y788_GRUJA